jgi:hypothetical protein
VTLTVRVSSSKWRAIEQRLRPPVVDAIVRATAFEIEGDVKRRIMSGSKTGRIYLRGKRRRRHQASAPGESPATDTGALASSYRARRVRSGTWRVGSSKKYAAPLEFRLNRPHLRRAFAASKVRFKQRMKTLLETK